MSYAQAEPVPYAQAEKGPLVGPFFFLPGVRPRVYAAAASAVPCSGSDVIPRDEECPGGPRLSRDGGWAAPGMFSLSGTDGVERCTSGRQRPPNKPRRTTRGPVPGRVPR